MSLVENASAEKSDVAEIKLSTMLLLRSLQQTATFTELQSRYV
jgi:hypothetical protein